MIALDAYAFFVPESDTVLADIYLFDSVTSKYVPNRILSARAQLLSGDNVFYTIAFDRRMGTSTGAIRIVVSHPVQRNGLTLEVQVLLDTQDRLEKTVPVSKRPKSAFEGANIFSEQPLVTDSMDDPARILG